MQFGRAGFEFPLAQQVGLVLAQVLLVQLVRSCVEVFGEPFDGVDVTLYSSSSVVSTLEFLQHHLT
jgi:hypothetical protein